MNGGDEWSCFRCFPGLPARLISRYDAGGSTEYLAIPRTDMALDDQPSADVPPDADRPTHSPDGVDLTLIRWMLSLTPAERLEVLQQHLRAVARLRDANPHL